MNALPDSPLGTEIGAADVIELFGKLATWEDKYRQVILLGKKLPVMPEAMKSEQVQVAGCESQVWLVCQSEAEQWWFWADSDARIVRGLIAIVLAAVQGKTASEINAFDMDDYFAKLDLLSHLSASRGNGLKAIIDQIHIHIG